MFVAAGIALDTQKAVFEQAALQVVVELLFDERGQRSAFGYADPNTHSKFKRGL